MLALLACAQNIPDRSDPSPSKRLPVMLIGPLFSGTMTSLWYLRSKMPSGGRLNHIASLPIQFALAAHASRVGVALGHVDIPANIVSMTACGGTMRAIVG
jgi:hypothetical protein